MSTMTVSVRAIEIYGMKNHQNAFTLVFQELFFLQKQWLYSTLCTNQDKQNKYRQKSCLKLYVLDFFVVLSRPTKKCCRKIAVPIKLFCYLFTNIFVTSSAMNKLPAICDCTQQLRMVCVSHQTLQHECISRRTNRHNTAEWDGRGKRLTRWKSGKYALLLNSCWTTLHANRRVDSCCAHQRHSIFEQNITSYYFWFGIRENCQQFTAFSL